MKCRICNSKDLKLVFSLGKQPLANNFVEKGVELKKYPLDLYKCRHCTLLQIGKIVSKEEMFDNYLYIPSVSKTYLENFARIAKKLTTELKLIDNDLVVDIGGNDGSLLVEFKKLGMDVINIEPAKNIKVKEQILTYTKYFTTNVARFIVKYKGKAKLATATNVFAHIDNLHEFIRALDILLDDDGVFFAQFPDARNLMSENQFDTIYHEHLSYFTYEPLYYLFANTPFELFKITSDNIHGGSMQIWVRRRPKLVQSFVRNAKQIKKNLVKIIKNYKKQGKKVVGFGAAAKGTVLLNYCGLDNKLIDYIVDGTSYKQGKFVPGVNIPIYPEEHLLKDKPDVVLILAWNFKTEIMEKLKDRGYKFIVPIPKVTVI